MALILLEKKTAIKSTVRAGRTQHFSHYVLTETVINFNTDTRLVETAVREYQEGNQSTGDFAVKNPFYINPSAEFYKAQLSPVSFRIYTYTGNGVVTSVDVFAGISCNLAIKSPVQVTHGTTGTATIEYTGTASDSLLYGVGLKGSTEITWQPANVFTNLPFAYYTAYIQDLKTGCAASAGFFISDVVAYGSRYFIDFTKTTTGEPCRLEIHKKNYTGEPVDLVCVSDVPIILSKRDDGDKYEALKSTQADITLLSFTRQKYLDFFSADEREHRIDLLVNGQLYHRSYVLPDVYREPFLAAPYPVSITASDGLNTLKNYAYTDPSGEFFTGERTWLNIIFDCLDKLDLGLPLRSVVDVYEVNMFETSGVNDTGPIISDPLFQASVSTDIFLNDKGLPLDCEKVLRMVLNSLKARVYQDNGMWVVECIDAKRAEYWAVNYNADRSFKSYEKINPVVLTTRPLSGGLQWIHGEQGLDITAAYKKVVLESNLAVVQNLAKGGELRDVDFEETSTLSIAKIKGWTASAPFSRIIEGKTKNSVSFNTPAPGPAYSTLSAAKYWQSGEFMLQDDGKTSLLVRIDCQLYVGPEEGKLPVLAFKIKSQEWVWVANGIRWAAAEPRGAGYVTLQPGKNSFEFITPPLRGTGKYSLYIYEAMRDDQYLQTGAGPISITNFRLDSATVQVLPEGYKPKEYINVEINNPDRYTYTPPVEEITFVDTPLNKNFAQIHKNYITVNGKQSTQWHIKGAPLPEPGTSDGALISVLAANVAYNYIRPPHAINGTLQGKLSYQQTIKERWDKSRIFIIDGFKENIRLGQYSVSLRELILPLPKGTGNPVVDSGSAFVTEDKTMLFLTENLEKILVIEDFVE